MIVVILVNYTDSQIITTATNELSFFLISLLSHLLSFCYCVIIKQYAEMENCAGDYTPAPHSALLAKLKLNILSLFYY